jgi:hypothetical protein
MTSPVNKARAALAALGCLLLTQCLMDDKHAGTSTSAENTISAVARLPGGGPAAGAVVHARTGKTVVSRYGVPESRLIGFAVADGQGRFKLALADTDAFFLEVKAKAADTLALPDSFPPVFFRQYAGKAMGKGKGDSSLGTLDLLKSGSFQGRLQPDSGAFPKAVWIGIRGTDNFVKVEAKAGAAPGLPFGLREVYPGLNPLAILIPAEVGIATVDLHPHEVDSVPPASAQTGAVTDLGVISFPKP